MGSKRGAEELNLPAGFRFHPTDDELVNHYLCKKCQSQPISAPIIAEIDLYKFDPWDLPDMALYGEKEWYFFSPRDRKYPNGSRPNRAAANGYWKATGADKPIGKPKAQGIKKALVFYAGKAPRGTKTNWIMHEYRLANVDRAATKKNNLNLRLDDWVLCRIYNKKGNKNESYPSGLNDQKKLLVKNPKTDEFSVEEQKPIISMAAAITNGMLPLPPLRPPQATAASNSIVNGDFFHMDTPESMPWLHTESSSSDHVLSPGEVQSDSTWEELDNVFAFNYKYNYVDAPFDSQFNSLDMLTYLQNPFD